MTYRDEAQIEAEYRQRMGQSLGQLFCALWRELVWLHIKWGEYVGLFGTSPKRVDLLNQSAPNFFGIIQRSLLDDILLHLARMTDHPKSAGKDTLAIRTLLAQVDLRTKSHIEKLIERAEHEVAVCRELRNRRIAHNELALALNHPSASPLQPISRAQVNEAIRSLGDVLNAVEKHYGCSPSAFEHTIPALGGADSLFEVIETGLITERNLRHN